MLYDCVTVFGTAHSNDGHVNKLILAIIEVVSKSYSTLKDVEPLEDATACIMGPAEVKPNALAIGITQGRNAAKIVSSPDGDKMVFKDETPCVTATIEIVLNPAGTGMDLKSTFDDHRTGSSLFGEGGLNFEEGDATMEEAMEMCGVTVFSELVKIYKNKSGGMNLLEMESPGSVQ